MNILRHVAFLVTLPACALSQRAQPSALRTGMSVVAFADSGASWFDGRPGAQFFARAALAVAGASLGYVLMGADKDGDWGLGLIKFGATLFVATPVAAALPRLGSKCSTGSRYLRAVLGGLLGIVAATWYVFETDGTAAQNIVAVPAVLFGASTSFIIQRCRPVSPASERANP